MLLIPIVSLWTALLPHNLLIVSSDVGFLLRTMSMSSWFHVWSTFTSHLPHCKSSSEVECTTVNTIQSRFKSTSDFGEIVLHFYSVFRLCVCVCMHQIQNMILLPFLSDLRVSFIPEWWSKTSSYFLIIETCFIIWSLI